MEQEPPRKVLTELPCQVITAANGKQTQEILELSIPDRGGAGGHHRDASGRHSEGQRGCIRQF